MITYQRMDQLSIADIVHLWNRAFKGYLVPVQMTEPLLLARLGKLKYAPRHSIVAYKGDRAVGFVAQAIESIDGKRIAWNGGTGVIPEERGTGVGKALIAESLRVLREEQVEIATLEAIETNDPAIRLYENMGYQIIQPLYFYTLAKDPVSSDLASPPPTLRYRHRLGYEIKALSFWPKAAPWQNHPAHIPLPEAWIGYQGEDACAALLFERRQDAEGQLQLIIYQISIREDFDIRFYGTELLRQWMEAFPADSYQTFNLVAPPALCQVLEQAGFQKQRGQVWMENKRFTSSA